MTSQLSETTKIHSKQIDIIVVMKSSNGNKIKTVTSHGGKKKENLRFLRERLLNEITFVWIYL